MPSVFCVSQNLVKIFLLPFKKQKELHTVYFDHTQPLLPRTLLLTFLKSISQSLLLPLCHFPPLTIVSSLYHPPTHGCGTLLSIVNRPVATPVRKNCLSFSQNPPAVRSTSPVGWGSSHQHFHPRTVTGLSCASNLSCCEFESAAMVSRLEDTVSCHSSPAAGS